MVVRTMYMYRYGSSGFHCGGAAIMDLNLVIYKQYTTVFTCYRGGNSYSPFVFSIQCRSS